MTRAIDWRLPTKQAQAVRDLIEQILDGTLEVGKFDIDLPDEFTLRIIRNEDSVELDWSENPEINLPGPDGEMLGAEVFEDHALVEVRAYGFAMTIRIHY